jgi:hypothetical protein
MVSALDRWPMPSVTVIVAAMALEAAEMIITISVKTVTARGVVIGYPCEFSAIAASDRVSS